MELKHLEARVFVLVGQLEEAKRNYELALKELKEIEEKNKKEAEKSAV